MYRTIGTNHVPNVVAEFIASQDSVRRSRDELVERFEAAILESDGLTMPEAARRVLSRYVGFESRETGAGLERARQPFSLTHELVEGEGDRLVESERRLGRRLYPIGVWGSYADVLAIDDGGVIYAVHGNGYDKVGNTIEAAFETFLVGLRALDDSSR